MFFISKESNSEKFPLLEIHCNIILSINILPNFESQLYHMNRPVFRIEKLGWTKKEIMDEFDCMPSNNDEWIYSSSIGRNNDQKFGQTRHSKVKGKTKTNFTKPKIPTTTISSAFSVLMLSYWYKFTGKQNYLPVYTNINGELRHEEILVSGILGFFETDSCFFPFTNECLVCQKILAIISIYWCSIYPSIIYFCVTYKLIHYFLYFSRVIFSSCRPRRSPATLVRSC